LGKKKENNHPLANALTTGLQTRPVLQESFEKKLKKERRVWNWERDPFSIKQKSGKMRKDNRTGAQREKRKHQKKKKNKKNSKERKNLH